MVPDPRGNLSATHQAAARIKDFLMVELKSKETEVWIDYSGAFPPPGVAGNTLTQSYTNFFIYLISSSARTATALGWLVLVAMVLWVVYYVNTRHSGARRVSMAEVRARLTGPASTGAPGWRQDDLLALRSRVQAQFRCSQGSTILSKKCIFSGFATFKNEGEGEVEIVGVGKEEGSADLSGGSGMILSTQELQNCKTKIFPIIVIDDLNFQQHQI